MPIPAWLLNILIKLAVSIGLPWLMKKFPGLPAEVWAILEEILKHVNSSDDKAAAVKQVREKVRQCTGVACETGIKRD